MTTRPFSYALKSKLPGGLCLIIIGTEGLERVPALAHVLLPGFVGFAVLFGLAFTSSSLPADVELVKRLGQIVAASLYALSAISLAMPLAHRLQQPAGAPAA